MSAALERYPAPPTGRITLAHGGGGRAMRELIERILVPAFSNPLLAPLEDQARMPIALTVSLSGFDSIPDRDLFSAGVISYVQN